MTRKKKWIKSATSKPGDAEYNGQVPTYRITRTGSHRLGEHIQIIELYSSARDRDFIIKALNKRDK